MEIVSAEQAVAHIGSGDLVHVHGTCATPSVLLDALVARAPELVGVRISHLHTEGPAPHLDPAVAGAFRHLALFIGANARQAIADGRADYIPAFLSDVPRLFASRALPVDTVLLNTTRPDAHGFVSLGTSVDVMPAAIGAATHVVAQLNASMPRTLGASFVHVDDIEYGVEVDAPPWSVHPGVIGDIQRRIGEHVAARVLDGATLQLGIGAIPSAVTDALHGHRDLGIHTEVFTDAVVDLVERGVVTGSHKELDRGAIVTAFLMGSPRLWSFVDDNPMVQMRPVDYTNDTAIIRRFRRMTSINSAIEIDLTGQVVADSIGGRFYSGIGGQMDFVRGAALAPEGQAIICLPATAAHDAVSRIVARLTPGGGVVTTRGHVHTVVTEYGVAELHGRTIRERAVALIAIAHPDFREGLEREAWELGLLGARPPV